MIALKPDGKPDDSGRQVYEAVVAKVTARSKYNEEEFSLSDIEGYWSIAPYLKEKMGVPPIGTIAFWTLATKPKTGPNAKPGSLYRDVIAVGKVPAVVQEAMEERADVSHARTTRPPGAIAQDEALPAEWTLPLSYYRERQKTERESIQRQVVFKAISELLIAFREDPALLPDGSERFSAYLIRRWLQLDEMLVPQLPPVYEPEIAPIDQSAGKSGA